MEEKYLKYERMEVICIYHYEKGLMGLIFAGSMDTDPIMMFQREFFNQIWMPKYYNYIVDMENVNFISSSGLGFIMMLEDSKKDYLLISKLPVDIKDAFELLGIMEWLTFYESVEEIKEKVSIDDEFFERFKRAKEKLTPMEAHLSSMVKRTVKILAEYVGEENVITELDKMQEYFDMIKSSNEIIIPAQRKFTSVVYQFLFQAICVEAGITSIKESHIEMVARELMTNAINHGYGGKEIGKVRLQRFLGKNELVIYFVDYGRGFTAPKKGHHGRGLALMRKIFDEVNIGIPKINEEELKKLGITPYGKGAVVELIKRRY